MENNKIDTRRIKIMISFDADIYNKIAKLAKEELRTLGKQVEYMIAEAAKDVKLGENSGQKP
ncbi:MAG TPA: hypothetical protein ENG87_05380 [Candidatus Pacearchaeota archaeon]|nr:hypothetical protein [Candidatus Pacearchaeota archaeon]